MLSRRAFPKEPVFIHLLTSFGLMFDDGLRTGSPGISVCSPDEEALTLERGGAIDGAGEVFGGVEGPLRRLREGKEERVEAGGVSVGRSSVFGADSFVFSEDMADVGTLVGGEELWG